MKYRYTSIVLFFLLSCQTSTLVKIDNKTYEGYRPPNCIQIADNLFADETEVANTDYKEYMQWNLRVYGKDSKEYLSALPDSNVWTEVSYGMPLMTHYYKHPSYNDYPVIGLTLEQAKNYSAWRTERVAEMYLNMKGCIKKIKTTDGSKTFTIERYLNGNFEWIIKKETFLLARYKIPTIEEWEQLAGGNSKFRYGVDSLSRHNKKLLKSCKILFNTKDIKNTKPNKKCNSYLNNDLPSYNRDFSKNVNNLYNTIGNVAEMIDAPNTSKGGSWHHHIDDIEITKNDTFSTPNSWTGFRNVCALELIEIK